MKYEYKSSFDWTFKRLPPSRKKKVEEAISLLIDFFETGTKAKGLGLRNLRGDFWEIRADIRDRIIFVFKDGKISFIIVGTHDEIRRFLRKI